MKVPNSVITDNKLYTGASATTWDGLIENLCSNSNNVDDKIIKEELTKRINEILDKDETIEIMKMYLFRFIEENIDNPENLIKEFLKEKDEEINKYKQELESCKKDIKSLEDKFYYISNQLQYLFPPSISPYPTFDDRNIIWGTSGGKWNICN